LSIDCGADQASKGDLAAPADRWAGDVWARGVAPAELARIATDAMTPTASAATAVTLPSASRVRAFESTPRTPRAYLAPHAACLKATLASVS
jgi:hypothetical protein